MKFSSIFFTESESIFTVYRKKSKKIMIRHNHIRHLFVYLQ